VKVLVSGGAGFIGSTISSACLDDGITPIILDSLETGHRSFTRGRIFYHGDIADAELVDRIFVEHPDIWSAVHCASLVVVADSVAHPLRYYRENVAKAVDFVDHLVRNGCGRLIFSSSASVYGGKAALALDETAPLEPASPYARGKVMLEEVLADCTRAYDLRVMSLRYFNPIGADPSLRSGQQVSRPTHVLGRIIEACDSGGEFQITGVDWPTRDGTGMRDYIHVWDLARAHTNAIAISTRCWRRRLRTVT
jgi:UDP-glucose 4-epimerase